MRILILVLSMTMLACGADDYSQPDAGVSDAADADTQPADESASEWLAEHPDCVTAWELWSEWGERCGYPVLCSLDEWAFYAERGRVEESMLPCRDQVLQAVDGDASCDYYPPTAAPAWVHFCDPRYF